MEVLREKEGVGNDEGISLVTVKDQDEAPCGCAFVSLMDVCLALPVPCSLSVGGIKSA